MKKTKEEGITLVALTITIVLLLILASVGINSGRKVIDSSKFNKFKMELQIMQNKVNEYNQNNELNVGNNLNESQNNILEKEEISSIIYKDKSNEEKNEIKSGFKFCSNNYIINTLGIKGITQSFLINIEKRIVISVEGFNYEGITYYMSEQMGKEAAYNVEYKNKNGENGTFEVTTDKEGSKWKISITNINYDGYVDKWTVKYKLINYTYWNTSSNLSFYIDNPGTYIIQLVHGEDIQLDTETIKIYDDYVSDNLILHYDAINNTGTETQDKTATTWTDLSNSENNAEIHGATWEDKYLSFDGIDDYAKTLSAINYQSSKEMTIEILDVGRSLLENSNNTVLLESSENTNQNTGSFCLETNEYGTNDLCMFFFDNKYNLRKTSNNLELQQYSVYDIVLNTSNQNSEFIKIYINGKKKELNIPNDQTSNNSDISSSVLQNYVAYLCSRAGNTLFTKMNIGALRVYNRELANYEIESNVETDLVRFQ